MMRYERSDNKWTKTKEDLEKASKNKFWKERFERKKSRRWALNNISLSDLLHLLLEYYHLSSSFYY